MRPAILIAFFVVCCHPGAARADELVLDGNLHHLRIEGPREWDEFPETPEAARLERSFTAQSNKTPQTLRLRQQDVKQPWRVTLNETPLGALPNDENDMVIYFAVPPGALRDGENILRIAQNPKRPADDIRIGEIVLDSRTTAQALSEAAIEVEVTDADSKALLPSRLTIVNAGGALQTTGAQSNNQLAVRPGSVLTANGRARFGVPAGSYTIYAGRGFEYSLAQESVQVAAGESRRLALSIRREVPTEGYVASDTHLHTFTHSGHGDASLQERIITVAAEGIELPIAADHDVAIDYNPMASDLNVRQYFTPVVGSEITTPTAHFNIFPVAAGATLPDRTSKQWKTTLDGIYKTPGVKVALLNHARDLHSGIRPFGPELFNEAVGENLDGWYMGFNAMEVFNSGATQTDPLELLRDWMTLLNRGRRVTPVGSSDSHDVTRHFPGQGRTYIRADDRDLANLDIEQAVDNFVQGRVMVSYGLLAEITVNGKYGPGELATTPEEEVNVAVRVLGPHWVTADRVTLYANGKPVREQAITGQDRRNSPRGVLWSGEWMVPKPAHDVHLVAVATGPGVDGWYWKAAKPSQPDSPHFEARQVGISGAVWLDADGDGRPTPAYDYARHLVERTRGDVQALLGALVPFDEAVAAQAAHLVQTSGASIESNPIQQLLSKAAPAAQAGFQSYLRAKQETERAHGNR
jgi:hypothetical protein